MITDFSLPRLNGIDVNEFWLQQDDATCYTIGLLRETLEERIISRNGPVNQWCTEDLIKGGATALPTLHHTRESEGSSPEKEGRGSSPESF